MIKILGFVIIFITVLCLFPITATVAQFKSQAIATNNKFSTALLFPTPQPSISPTPSPGNGFNFPMCESVLPKPGDKAHYLTGKHQIIGGSLLSGSDDVYGLENNNFLQCFCPEVGNKGIQTDWLRTDQAINGWFLVNGSQWNLGNFNYAAQNRDFTCQASSLQDIASPAAVATSSAL